jgi:hypothetical protein
MLGLGLALALAPGLIRRRVFEPGLTTWTREPAVGGRVLPEPEPEPAGLLLRCERVGELLLFRRFRFRRRVLALAPPGLLRCELRLRTRDAGLRLPTDRGGRFSLSAWRACASCSCSALLLSVSTLWLFTTRLTAVVRSLVKGTPCRVAYEVV